MESPSKSPYKDTYRVRNWKAYNKSLQKRGKISVWLSESLLSTWRDLDVMKICVGEQIYPDAVIEFCLTVKYVYKLAFRQTTGFVEDILLCHGCAGYCVPDYSTLCRRSKGLCVQYSSKLQRAKDLHILVDSTGIKVYGQGEWMVKKHGVSKNRRWLKLHLCVEANTQEVVCMSLTDNSIDDANEAKRLLEGCLERLSSVRGDGAYDKFFFRECLGREVRQIIPPPRNAVVKTGRAKEPVAPYLEQRNQAVLRCQEIGRSAWKKEIGYHRRSLAETAVFRYKVIFGDKATAKTEENQLTEAKIKCKILNVFSGFGIPKTERVFKN